MPVVITQRQEFADMSLSRQVWEPATSFFTQSAATANSTNKIQMVNNGTSSIEEFTASYNAYADSNI
jgi:hypothetical protein